MKKLRLEVDDLTVTSFAVDADRLDGTGTVEAHGFAPTRQTRCVSCDTLCPTCATYCAPYC
jgi:hypothetical protein